MIAAPDTYGITSASASDAQHDGDRVPGTDASGAAFEAVLAAVGTPHVAVAVRRAAPSASEVFDAPDGALRQVRLDAMKREARQQDLIGDDSPSALREPRTSVRAEAPRPETLHDGEGPRDAKVADRSRAEVLPGEAIRNGECPPDPKIVDGVSRCANESQRGLSTSRSTTAETPPGMNAAGMAPAAPTGPGSQVPGSVSPSPAELIGRSLIRGQGGQGGQGGLGGLGGQNDGAPLRADRAPMTPQRGSDAADGREAAKSKPTMRSGSPTTEAEADNAPETNFERIVRSIRMHQGSHRSQAILELDPPELGRVRIEAHLTGQRLELQIHTETPEAKQVLAERIVELRQALENHGLEWGELSWLQDETGEPEDQPREGRSEQDGEQARFIGEQARFIGEQARFTPEGDVPWNEASSSGAERMSGELVEGESGMATTTPSATGRTMLDVRV